MIQIFTILQEFVEKYDLKDKAHIGYIFKQVDKGMHGISQSGQITHDSLVQHLEPYGYRPSNKTPGLWIHDIQTINFALVVNDFGAKY